MKKIIVSFLILAALFFVQPSFTHVYAAENTQIYPQKVDVNKQWVITFNRSVNPETVSDQSIYISRADTGDKVPVTFSYENKSQKVIVSPKVNYTPGATYILSITDKVKSSSGRSLKAARQLQFQVNTISTDGLKTLRANLNLVTNSVKTESERALLNQMASVLDMAISDPHKDLTSEKSKLQQQYSQLLSSEKDDLQSVAAINLPLEVIPYFNYLLFE